MKWYNYGKEVVKLLVWKKIEAYSEVALLKSPNYILVQLSRLCFSLKML